MNGPDEPLDFGLIADIPKSKEHFERLAQFHWEYYSELEFLRSQIYDSLKASLRERTKPFEFSGWQRAVKYRYSLAPLSTKGSCSDPGGRFNIGVIDASRFPVFPALYLACDKKTALAELLGRDGPADSLTPEELALTKPTSITVVSVSGKLESVLDVRDAKNLAGFVNLVKDFKLSSRLIMKARRLGFPAKVVRDTNQLVKGVQMLKWREWPMVFDVPSLSQIFGRIVLDAGIEGILYESVLTHNLCSAIYPQNFQNSSSYIELDDPCPPETIHKRIDSTTFKKFI